ncbi:MAG TPA: NAD(P)/FAD-dependent oxidoreductase [Thermomicrobiaceae bacterium]|nr:NAD(P)/FAD-dependent oxidoreductase [Thermomicrobiaceae bacterium]
MATRSTDAGEPRYDAVVIGSGAAGLTCATRLAQDGLRVLLAEKNDWVGGYSHGFSQDGFYWDHGGHIFLAYRLGAQAREVFQRLGLEQRLEMVPDQHDYRCVFPDEALAIPADISAAADTFAQRFPEERDAIARVLLIMESMIDEVDRFVPAFRVMRRPGERHLMDPIFEQLQRPTLSKVASRVIGGTRLPGANLVKYHDRTLKQLLDEHLKDPTLKGYFSMLSAGIGIGPGRLSAPLAGVFFIHALRTMWMPKGGFGKLGETLAEMFQEQGGTLATGAEVVRINTSDGRVSGVELADGRHVRAEFVVSAADARRTFLDMLDPSLVPASFRRALPTMDLTPTIFQVQLGVDMDLTPYRKNIQRLNFIYENTDIDKAISYFPSGDVEKATYFLYVATFHQPEMAPPGQHSIKLEAYTKLNVPGIDWDRDREKIADTFVRRAEKMIPGLSQHVVTRATRTPADLLRDTGNAEGAFAGWAFTPQFLTRGRPPQRTTIPGLYLAGHWTRPSAGVPWVMLSGYNTAGMVIADRTALRRRRAKRQNPAVPETVTAEPRVSTASD